MSLGDVMGFIERTARWADRKTFDYLPVWYPEHMRKGLFYKSNWSEPQMNRNRQSGVSVHKAEGNLYANKALTQALGLTSTSRPNWSCCHIWGVDDARYQVSNSVVQDRRYYSCIANMVLLPTPLKAFTDVMPEVKAMLRVCALHLYDWYCEHPDVAEAARQVVDWSDWEDYPASWPRADKPSVPLGLVPFSGAIAKSADRRRAAIWKNLRTAGPHYPRQEVRDALSYWRIDLQPTDAPS